jgi:endogenous inhibitor of DNA gyrase (YacG/DUF329 family)
LKFETRTMPNCPKCEKPVYFGTYNKTKDKLPI